jgi:hypothetical protein
LGGALSRNRPEHPRDWRAACWFRRRRRVQALGGDTLVLDATWAQLERSAASLDPGLFSGREAGQYRIQAADGSAGQVEDFLVNTD